ncbi:MAG: hypothetical protein Q4C77_04590 [Eubacteriales bacterium]|nr:hypothetical protein [Eubacteriales bacterium]
MKNRKVLAILAMTISMSCVFSACGLFGGGEDEEQVVAEVTPTPEPTEAPDPTPTIAPNAQTNIYTSKDKNVSIKLPDATWDNKTDETDMLSFESPEQGRILITHGAGEADMSVAVLPSTQDMAVSLEQAADLEQGTDFEIQDYSATQVEGANVYSYVTKMLNTEKSGGYAYVVNKVFANDEEYYNIAGSVKTEDALAGIKEAVESFAILGDSTLKSAAPQGSSGNEGESGADGQNAAGTQGTDGQSQGGTQGTGGENTDSGYTDGGYSDGGYTDDGYSDSGYSDDGYSDGGDSYTIPNSAGFTQEQLTDTNQTRTIYRNSDGHPLVITPNGDGSWSDFDGNVYEFVNDEDVYDQDGVDYYYHGEGADVYYMPVE